MDIPIDASQLDSIKGFLDPDEGRRLYEIAMTAGRLGPCLEIGGFCGKSTLYIGTACRENNSVLYSVDHHRGSEEHQPGEAYFDPELFDPAEGRIDTFRRFRRTLIRAGLEETVVPMVCPSHVAARAWSTPLAMVFIDGGHSHAAAFTDYAAWAGHIPPGGFLVIHDIFKDPQAGGQAPYRIYKLAAGSGLFIKESGVKTLGVLRRRQPGEIPDGSGDGLD